MKSPRQWPLPVVLLVAFALLSLSCGLAANQARKSDELHALGVMYHTYHDAYRRGPSKVEDLEPFAVNLPEKDALQGVRTGKYTFIWNANLLDPANNADGTQNTILAYEPSAETSKGQVLFLDGSTKDLTSSEFKSKKLATPQTGK